MALSDKNIVITPSIGLTTDPKIVFSGADNTSGPQNITMQIYPTNGGTLSLDGSTGQLFAVQNTLSGSIYSVNDIQGIPSFEILDTGVVKLAQYSGNVLLGSGVDDGLNKLQITGNLSVSGTSTLTGVVTGNGSGLTSLNASNLSSGTVSAARLPASTGDVTSPAGSSVFTLANSGVTAGTYTSTTVDAKGRVTAGSNPTTLAGYGITDALSLSGGTLTSTLNGTSIYLSGAIYTDTIHNRTGTQLVLNAGESAGQAGVQNQERIYLNAEGGVCINTPDAAHSNWDPGFTVKTAYLMGDSLTLDGNVVWHQGNDGTGSGLDADLLDGLHASNFFGHYKTHTTQNPNLAIDGVQSGDASIDGTVRGWQWLTTLSPRSTGFGAQIAVSDTTNGYMMIRSKLDGQWAPWTRVFTSQYMGHGSGLNADLLDGKHIGTSGSAVPVLDGVNTWTGNQNFNEVTASSFNVATTQGVFTSVSDITSAVLVGSFSVAGTDTEPRDLEFSTDGTKMYILGNAGDDITQYTLTTPWSVATATAPVTFALPQDSTPYGLFMKADGTAFYTCGSTTDSVHQYSMSTPWSITTASFVRSKSINAQETDPHAVAFKPDGTIMYVIGSVGDDVNQYSLSTAWDISTATYVSATLVNNKWTGVSSAQSLYFSADGARMWIMGSGYARLSEFTLTTPWNSATAVFSKFVNLMYAEDSNDYSNFYTLTGLSGAYINETQKRLYVSDYNHDRVFEFDLSPVLTLSGRRVNLDVDTVAVKNNLHVNKNMWITGDIRSSGTFYPSAIYTNTFNGTSSSATTSYGTGNSTGSVNLATGLSSGALTIGGTAATGTMTFGRSTATNTINIGSGVTASGSTQTINFGTGGAAGSTTIFNLGSSTGTVNYNLLGTTLTFNGAAIPTVSTANSWSQLQTMSSATIGTLDISSFSSSDTDVTSQILGSTFGAILEAPVNAHVVIGIRGNDSDDGFYIIDTTNGSGAAYNRQLFVASPNQLKYLSNDIWHAGNDGSGSGLDADLLDGLNSTSFLRSNATTTYSGGLLRIDTPTGALGSSTGGVNTLQIYQATSGTDAFMTFHVSGDYAGHFGIDGTTNDLFFGGWSAGAVKNKIWHAGNDGSGSGLDADLLDGMQPSTSSTANTIAQRNSSGYLYASYLNMSNGDITTMPTRVAIGTSTDGFLRWQSMSQFKTNLGAVTIDDSLALSIALG